MCPALGEAAQAKPLLAGESYFVVDLPRCAGEGLPRENMVWLLTLTMVMGPAKEATAIMAEACRLLKGPSEAGS